MMSPDIVRLFLDLLLPATGLLSWDGACRDDMRDVDGEELLFALFRVSFVLVNASRRMKTYSSKLG